MTTQKAFFSYEEVIDLHTETGRVSVIGIHTPTGDTPRRLCPGFFDQFRKYKYLGCSVALVPAATLPADPLSVSYEAGEPTIDPRDMLNPILWHGCHGNDLGNILNRLYSSGLVSGSDVTQLLHSDSLDLINMMNVADIDGALNILESLYYRALTDKTWKKANVQRGFKKAGLRPRIYSLATNMQLQSVGSLGGGFNAPGPFGGEIDALNDEVDDFVDPNVNPVRYFTPRTVPLGWLDTRNVVPYVAGGEIGTVDGDDFADTVTGLIQGKTVWMELPKVFMGVILLPPAYKTEMYFRMVINHYFAFAGFRGISMSNEMLEMPPNYDNWNDLLSSGESVDPEPEPEPEPVPPTPSVTSGVYLDLPDALGNYLTRARYYDANGDVAGTIAFDDSAGHFEDNDTTGFTGTIKAVFLAAQAWADYGISSGETVTLGRLTANSTGLQIKGANSTSINPINSGTWSGLVAILPASVSIDFTTAGLMFSTTNVESVNDD